MARSPSFDYVVVGAGSAGCVIASRLSAHARVLLLEAGVPDSGVRGGEDIGEVVRVPENVIRATWDKTISSWCETVRQRHLADRRIIINRGIVRGGCSSVNGMIYVRGNRRDYDTWAQLGNEGWSFPEVLPYFKKSEDFDGAPLKYAAADLDFHGSGGPLHVRPIPKPTPAALAFVDAARHLGLGASAPDWDFNGHEQENGGGLYQVTVTADGSRASAARAFLDPPASSNRLTVLTGVRVSSIVVDHGRAVGVECVDGGGSRVYRAEREVIVSAGAFGSPKLLMLSGIGPADHLAALGITPLVDLPGVGANLHDHLMIVVCLVANADTGQSQFTAEAELFLQTRDRSGAASPDLQYHVLGRLPPRPAWIVEKQKLPEWYFMICPTMVKPLSRGTVRLRSDVPDDEVLIQPNYLECDADVQVFVRGLVFMRELLATPSLRALVRDVPPFALPGAGTPVPMPSGSGSELCDFIAATPTTPWHPVGTCAMGRDRLAVVDPTLRVRGVENLRVADASIMPVIPSGNINAACIMIGEKCADLIGR